MLGELKRQGYVVAICSNAKEDELEDVLGVLMDRTGADWCCMVGDRFYDREAAMANQAGFIGCRYGYGSQEEFGDGDLMAEDCREIPFLLERLAAGNVFCKYNL